MKTERKDYWHEKRIYTEAIWSKMFYGYFQNPHPLKLNPHEPELDEKYLIYGIDSILEENDPSLSQLGNQVHIIHEFTLHFQINSEKYLGIFLSYFLPRKWDKGVLLLFECGRSL